MVYFGDPPRKVTKVVVERGIGKDASCLYSVFLSNGKKKTLCGKYTGKTGVYNDETIQCGGT